MYSSNDLVYLDLKSFIDEVRGKDITLTYKRNRFEVRTVIPEYNEVASAFFKKEGNFIVRQEEPIEERRLLAIVIERLNLFPETVIELHEYKDLIFALALEASPPRLLVGAFSPENTPVLKYLLDKVVL